MAGKEQDTFKSLEELYLKLEMSKIPSDVIVSRSEKMVTFFSHMARRTTRHLLLFNIKSVSTIMWWEKLWQRNTFLILELLLLPNI